MCWRPVAARKPCEWEGKMPDGGERWELRRGGRVAPIPGVRAAPDTLHGMGDRSTTNSRSVTVPAARRPYGPLPHGYRQVVAESGITLVSGGALGCDAASMCAALDAEARRSW